TTQNIEGDCEPRLKTENIGTYEDQRDETPCFFASTGGMQTRFTNGLSPSRHERTFTHRLRSVRGGCQTPNSSILEKWQTLKFKSPPLDIATRKA
ncbi:hypothetical protein HAX54_046226, partial [Datura stramonium]|nr:hypothetical protein [Datura stramonium]